MTRTCNIVEPALEKKKILFFGFGYTAGFLASRLTPHGWTVTGTTTSAEKRAFLKKNGIESWVFDRSHALRFPVGVGRAGMTWTGKAHVEGKYVRPAWAPPESIRRENPHLPKVIAGGAADNPMGAAALTLRGGEYAIHGTNRPDLIGGFVSHGCIRMYNSDIRALYRLVAIGTPVIVER